MPDHARPNATAKQPLTFPLRVAPGASPDNLADAVEALLFVAPNPAELASLARALDTDSAAIEAALATLGDRLRGGVRLQRDGDLYQLVSAPEFGRYVERFLGVEEAGKLSTAALETLAIVAYQQPVTRAQIEAVRGVNSERALAALRARGLVDETGRAESPGRPALFGTTMRFLEYFGLEHPRDLPPLPEL
jgi:segregation and condensation protein B